MGIKITEKEYDNQKCYYIVDCNEEEIIDKKTGLLLYQKQIYNENRIETFKYSINTVTDEDVEKRSNLIEKDPTTE